MKKHHKTCDKFALKNAALERKLLWTRSGSDGRSCELNRSLSQTHEFICVQSTSRLQWQAPPALQAEATLRSGFDFNLRLKKQLQRDLHPHP